MESVRNLYSGMWCKEGVMCMMPCFVMCKEMPLRCMDVK